MPFIINLDGSIDDASYSDDVVMALDDDHGCEGLRPRPVHELSNKDVLYDGLVRQVLTHLFPV